MLALRVGPDRPSPSALWLHKIQISMRPGRIPFASHPGSHGLVTAFQILPLERPSYGWPCVCTASSRYASSSVTPDCTGVHQPSLKPGNQSCMRLHLATGNQCCGCLGRRYARYTQTRRLISAELRTHAGRAWCLETCSSTGSCTKNLAIEFLSPQPCPI